MTGILNFLNRFGISHGDLFVEYIDLITNEQDSVTLSADEAAIVSLPCTLGIY